MVCVRPGVFEATTITAPNSPIALAQKSTIPPTIPFQQTGSVIVRKARILDAPKVAATDESLGSIASTLARTVRTSRGLATMPEPNAAAHQVNTIGLFIAVSKRSRQMPVTTGGSTNGIETIA